MPTSMDERGLGAPTGGLMRPDSRSGRRIERLAAIVPHLGAGFRPPLEEVSRFLRERGVLLYVDGTQSVGALQFDIKSVRPSVLCVDAYKWMLSPNGAGFLYVDPVLRQRLPATVVGWRSDRNWRSVASLNHPGFAELSATRCKHRVAAATL